MHGRYRSLSGTLIDPEKQERTSYESDSASHVSSDHPMLPSSGPRNGKFALRYQLPRRRFTRWFTLGIVSTLTLFAFFLVISHHRSEARVRELREHPPPPGPPAWDSFPLLDRYYGGIRALISRSENVPEFPNPAGEADTLKQMTEEAMDRKAKDDSRLDPESGFQKRDESDLDTRYATMPRGEKFDPRPLYHTSGFEPAVKCYLNAANQVEVPSLLAYRGVMKGFPDPAMGSYETLGLDKDVCFERFGRLGPYGLGYSKKFGGSGAAMEGDRAGVEDVWDGKLEIDYRNVDWAVVQQQCVDANKHRFKAVPEQLNHFYKSMASGGPTKDSLLEAGTNQTYGPTGQLLVPRTAVIIRTWVTYQYGPEEIMYLRALINELTIQSGGEYAVHFLIHVKDDNKQIWADDQVYQSVLNESLPEEFRGMGTLWTERQMGLIYGGLAESFYRGLPVHGVYRSTYMPLQYFAHQHPEYDYFWHWEMDVRYTGHFLHLFDRVASWAKQQPRKGLWDRSGRFYVPSEHGSYDDFKHQVRIETEKGTASKQSMYEKLAADAGSRHPLDTEARLTSTPIWGPMPPTGVNDTTFEPENDPQPPTTYDRDNYEWGVGEEADFITFNPLFDPHNTNWILAEDTTGYNTTENFPPRRTSIITASRLSARLLRTMHGETSLHRHTMFSEMWPGSCALHHGLKAVYAPHPVYIERQWPTSYLAAIFNNGLHGATGGARTSVFSDERQHNFVGTTWYYHAAFSPRLWRRWLGYRDNESGAGGEEWETVHEGRMCVPAMLLHPVKKTPLIVEHRLDEQ